MKRMHIPISAAVLETLRELCEIDAGEADPPSRDWTAIAVDLRRAQAAVPSERTASAETVDWMLSQLDYLITDINKSERFE